MTKDQILQTITDLIAERLVPEITARQIDEHLVAVTCPEGHVVLDDADKYSFSFDLAHWIKWSGDDVIYSKNGVATRIPIERTPAPSNDFSWALQQMKQGKSVRRSCWTEGRSISIDRKMFVDKNFELVELKTSDLVANDWHLTSSGPKVN